MTTVEHAPTLTVPHAGTTDGDLENLDIDFEAGEQAEKPITEEARLWWFNGLPTDRDVNAIGWHIKAGINPHLDETMEGLGIQHYLVQHKKPDRDGKNVPKPYWRLRQCNLIVVAQRIQSALEMRNPSDRYGIAYAWETVKDEQGKALLNKHQKEKRQTVLKLRVFIHEMYQHGYYDWLPVTLSGFTTDSMLEALAEQYRVLDCYSALRRTQNKNPIAPFYLFSIPTVPGSMKLVGELPDQGTIYPIQAKIPTTVNTAYLKEQLIPRDLIDRIRESLLTETIVWSIQESEKMASLKSSQEGSLALIEETTQTKPGPSEGTSDPFVQQPQLTWILRVYCGNNEQKARDICGYFGVPSTDQLRLSHFRTLVTQVQSAQNGKSGNP